ncbi:MAG: hypothetical protein AVDCRST_MAG67-1739, partial [uncultured Solirubrobacteraceae bacterium]
EDRPRSAERDRRARGARRPERVLRPRHRPQRHRVVCPRAGEPRGEPVSLRHRRPRTARLRLRRRGRRGPAHRDLPLAHTLGALPLADRRELRRRLARRGVADRRDPEGRRQRAGGPLLPHRGRHDPRSRARDRRM